MEVLAKISRHGESKLLLNPTHCIQSLWRPQNDFVPITRIRVYDEGDCGAILNPLYRVCACSLRQGKLRQKLHIVCASSCSGLSTQCE